jgi:hypothetical protein
MDLIELRTDETVFRPKGPGRSSGVHVSEIIRSIENEVTKPGKRRPYDSLTSDEKRRMGAYVTGGFAWEEVIREAVVAMHLASSDRFIPPGELELDGIHGTPDWFDTEDWCIEEFKATWRSSRRPITQDFWHWWVQIRAYCHMLGVRTARLRVFFVNGDYRNSGPQIKMWQATFTPEELIMNWAMLHQHAVEKGWLHG